MYAYVWVFYGVMLHTEWKCYATWECECKWWLLHARCKGRKTPAGKANDHITEHTISDSIFQLCGDIHPLCWGYLLIWHSRNGRETNSTRESPVGKTPTFQPCWGTQFWSRSNGAMLNSFQQPNLGWSPLPRANGHVCNVDAWVFF